MDLKTKTMVNKDNGKLIEPYRSFVEWLAWGPHPFVASVDAVNEEIVYYFTDEVDPKRYTLDELYDYWKTL